MTSTSYYGNICSGLFDPKQKTTALDRVVLVAPKSDAAETAPTALGLHKETAGFTALQLTGKDHINNFLPAKAESSQRHVAFGNGKLIFVSRTSQTKKNGSASASDSVIRLELSKKTMYPVLGVDDRVQDLVSLSDGVIVVCDSKFYWISDQSASSDSASAVVAVELKCKTKPLANVRFSSSEGNAFLIFSQNRIQSFRLSSKQDSLRSQRQLEVPGLGILFAKQTAQSIVVVSDSGAKLSKWSLESSSDSDPVVRKFDDKQIVSAAHVGDDFITIGHPQGAIEVLDASTLDTVCSYTCFPHPDDLIKEQQSVSAVGHKSPTSKNIHKSLEGLVTNVERFGKYIVATTDSAICIWNLDLKEVQSPIKVRLLKGRLASKLVVVSPQNDEATVFAAVARSRSNGDSKKDNAPTKVSPKDIRVDSIVWRLNSESLDKATKRIQKTAAYQRALDTLLSKTISKQLLEDVGFAHRLLLSTKHVRAGANLSSALVRLTSSLDVLPVYLTAAVEENIERLPEFATEWIKLLKHLTGDAPPAINKALFLIRESNFNISLLVDFIRMEGAKYLTTVWKSQLRKFQRASKEDWETDYKALYSLKKSSGGSKDERKAIRAECKAQAAKNAELVNEWAERFLNALTASSKEMPASIKDTMRYFVDKHIRSLPDDKADDIVRNGPQELLFTKFFVPALASPSLFGLVDSVSLASQINLGRISRLINSLALGRVENHPLASRASDLYGFICEIAGVNPQKPEKGSKAGAGTPVTTAPKNIKRLHGADFALQVDRDYFLVNQYIIKNAALLYEMDGENYNLQADTSVVLRTLAKQDLVQIKPEDDDCDMFCVRNKEEDVGDKWTETLIKPDFQSSMQDELSTRRGPPNENDIPHATLLSSNPKNHSTLRQWVTDEFKQHSFLVMLFYRGNWCPFCTRYMPNWNKYLSPILKRDGMIVGVSSMTQASSKKTAGNWKIEYPLIGDPFNELATMFNVDITYDDKRYKHGMSQPAIVVLSRSGESIYYWKTNATLGQLLGGIDRPRPYNVLSTVISNIKRPSLASGPDSDDLTELTDKSTMDSSASATTDSQISD